MLLDRKSFLGGFASAAALAAEGVPNMSMPQPRGPVRLRLGVLSDIHVTDAKSCEPFAAALRYFDGRKADGVLVCGDLADWGVVPQLERVAATWFGVFPKGRRSDGEPVANLLHYGDHDMCGYFYRGHSACVKEYPNVETMKRHIIPLNDPKAIWERCFHEPWAPIVHRCVKGYDFVLSHFQIGQQGNEWGNNVPGLAAFMSRLAPSLASGKPIFYSQHRIPRNTAGGPHIYGQDDGQTTKLFAGYPELLAFCGHKHLACADEQAIWQGAFTAVEVPSLSYNGTRGGRDNGFEDRDFDPWKPPRWQMPMIPLAPNRQGMFMTVYGNVLVIERRDFVHGDKIGPDWVLPLPLSGEHPYAPAIRAAHEPLPAFPPDAVATVKCLCAKERDGVEREVFRVSFPAAVSGNGTSRANDYEVTVFERQKDVERTVATKRVYSRAYMLPERFETQPVFCDFAIGSVPTDLPCGFRVRPLNAFGRAGDAIAAEFTPEALAGLTEKRS